jgi:hypothetical protein
LSFDNSDDASKQSGTDAKILADRLSGRPRAAGERRIDDSDGRLSAHLISRKETASDKPNLPRLEVAFADVVGLRFWKWLTPDSDRLTVPETVRTNSLDAGDRRNRASH